jgi:hypothetical protein
MNVESVITRSAFKLAGFPHPDRSYKQPRGGGEFAAEKSQKGARNR